MKNLAPSHSRPSCSVSVSSWHSLLHESILRLQPFSTSALWPAMQDTSEGTSYHWSAPGHKRSPWNSSWDRAGDKPLSGRRADTTPSPRAAPAPPAVLALRPSTSAGRGPIPLQEDPSHSKDAPTEDPTSGWVQREVKSRGPKEETEPETELSERNLVKKRRRGLKVSLLEGSRWPGSCASPAVALSQTDHRALTP